MYEAGGVCLSHSSPPPSPMVTRCAPRRPPLICRAVGPLRITLSGPVENLCILAVRMCRVPGCGGRPCGDIINLMFMFTGLASSDAKWFCIYLCMHVCECLYMHIYMCLYTHDMYLCTHMHVYICGNVYGYVYAHRHVCLHIRVTCTMCACLYLYVCMCVCVYKCGSFVCT